MAELREAAAHLPGDDVAEARTFVLDVYALTTEGFTDDQFQGLEDIIAKAMILLERLPGREAPSLIEALAVAMEGVQAGLPPNPANRPTREELASAFERGMTELGY